MRHAARSTIAACALVGTMAVCFGLTGCTVGAAEPVETSTPTATVPPTPTPTVEFIVGAGTVVPTPRRPRPTATPTRFVAPEGPYISLSKRTGPIPGQKIYVRGGHLPPNQQAQIEWAPEGRGAKIGVTAYTGKQGKLFQQLSVPAAQPGTYRVSIVISGVTYASTEYRVVSNASISVSVSPDARGDRVTVTGSHFLPRSHVLVGAYPLARKARPIVLGRATIPHNGRLDFSATYHLRIGEYVLHVFSTDSLTADLAYTYFQIEV